MQDNKGGRIMNGWTILGICLMLIGFLTIGYGGVEYGFDLDLDFQAFLVGGLLTALVGGAVISDLPVVVKLWLLALAVLSCILYIHSMPDDFEFMARLISDVAVLGMAAWLTSIFLRK